MQPAFHIVRSLIDFFEITDNRAISILVPDKYEFVSFSEIFAPVQPRPINPLQTALIPGTSAKRTDNHEKGSHSLRTAQVAAWFKIGQFRVTVFVGQDSDPDTLTSGAES
jgi:hypothetical protein